MSLSDYKHFPEETDEQRCIRERVEIGEREFSREAIPLFLDYFYNNPVFVNILGEVLARHAKYQLYDNRCGTIYWHWVIEAHDAISTLSKHFTPRPKPIVFEPNFTFVLVSILHKLGISYHKLSDLYKKTKITENPAWKYSLVNLTTLSSEYAKEDILEHFGFLINVPFTKQQYFDYIELICDYMHIGECNKAFSLTKRYIPYLSKCWLSLEFTFPISFPYRSKLKSCDLQKFDTELRKELAPPPPEPVIPFRRPGVFEMGSCSSSYTNQEISGAIMDPTHLCVMCKSARKSVLLLPCKCICVCFTCKKNVMILKKCPACSGLVEGNIDGVSVV